jgi:hypothetical protein
MSATVEDLERRIEAIESEMQRRKASQAQAPIPDCVPMDGTILEWYAAIRRQNAARGTIEERRKALGIPVDMPRVGAKKLRERMLAEGVRPEERLASSEIIRLREE